MKYLWIILFLLLSVPAYAENGMGPGPGFKTYVAGSSWSCSDASIFCENFNGSTACGNGTDSNCNYTYTVTSTNGVVSFSTASTIGGQNGPYVLRVNDTSSSANGVQALYNFTSTTTTYTQLYVKLVSDLNLDNREDVFFGTYLSGGTQQNYVLLMQRVSAGHYKFGISYQNYASANVEVYSTDADFALNTWYGVRVYWKTNQSSAGISWAIDKTLSGTFVDQGLTDGTMNRNVAQVVMKASNPDLATEVPNFHVAMVKMNATAYPAPTIP